MEHRTIPGTDLQASRIALGTWAIGGWMWGGTDEAQSMRTIRAAIDQGVTLIDTAPVYGFGRSEEILGRTIAEGGLRDRVIVATKVGLEWDDEGHVRRSSRAARLREELDASLRRLRTDTIDLYQVHWPDASVPFEETAEILDRFRQDGKIRAIGVSNFSTSQMERFRSATHLATSQPPYNIFEREIDDDVLPYCHETGVMLLTYGALCRGLLSGAMNRDRSFEGDDLRQWDPKFQEPRFSAYLEAVSRLEEVARERKGVGLLPFAVRWILDRGVEIAIWGARSPAQLEEAATAFSFSLDTEDMAIVDQILEQTITDPLGPEFMKPPES